MGGSEKPRDPFGRYVESVVQTAFLSKGYTLDAPPSRVAADLIVSKPKTSPFAVQFKSFTSKSATRKREVRAGHGKATMPVYYVLFDSKEHTVLVEPKLKAVVKDVFREFEIQEMVDSKG